MNKYLLTILLVIWPEVCAIYFTSVYKTRGLVEVERKMLNVLGAHIEEAETSGEMFSNEIKEFYISANRENQEAITVSSFIENPLNSFHFLKRMFKGWGRIFSLISWQINELLYLKLIRNIVCGDLNSRLEHIEEQYIGNRETMGNDYNGLLESLIRLRRTYNLDIKELIRGRIYGEQSAPLTYEDIKEICLILDDENDFNDQVLWLEAWLDVLEEQRVPLSEITAEIRALTSAQWKAGKRKEAILLLEKYKTEDPANTHLIAHTEMYKRQLELYPYNEPEFFDELTTMLDEERVDVERLCRGEGSRDIRITSQLICQYRRTCIPFYTVKEELMSIDPRISIMYDVITQPERETMKKIASDKLEDSVVTLDDGKRSEYKSRVSKTSWLNDNDLDPVVARLSKRVALITGLSTDNKTLLWHDAEGFQVLNYGFGGMYVAHKDNLAGTGTKDFLALGERVATWMFYLSPVRAGGSTVFPRLNITVPATEGAAVFWYNILRNGEADDRLRHSGCPVLLGSKWVANKWIREFGQTFRRKCGLTVDAIDGLVDNKNRCRI